MKTVQLMTGFDRITGDNEHLLRPSGVARNLSWGAILRSELRAKIRGKRPRAERDILRRGLAAPSPPATGSGDSKCISDALRAEKTRLVAANVVSAWEINVC